MGEPSSESRRVEAEEGEGLGAPWGESFREELGTGEEKAPGILGKLRDAESRSASAGVWLSSTARGRGNLEMAAWKTQRPEACTIFIPRRLKKNQ